MNPLIEQMCREAGIDPHADTLCRYAGWAEPLEALAQAVARRCAEICRTTDLFVDEWKAGHKCADAIEDEFGVRKVAT